MQLINVIFDNVYTCLLLCVVALGIGFVSTLWIQKSKEEVENIFSLNWTAGRRKAALFFLVSMEFFFEMFWHLLFIYGVVKAFVVTGIL